MTTEPQLLLPTHLSLSLSGMAPCHPYDRPGPRLHAAHRRLQGDTPGRLPPR